MVESEEEVWKNGKNRWMVGCECVRICFFGGLICGLLVYVNVKG